ncbi:Uncharacterised protein [Vibrio cholerae]|nr:Uncharacterised protein [Vibrio cholerae]
MRERDWSANSRECSASVFRSSSESSNTNSRNAFQLSRLAPICQNSLRCS